MPDCKKATKKLPENLSMLDDLIRRCYSELLKSIKENAKLGDFIKMIELRRKLAPGDSNQREFWKMLETIRQETASNRRVKKSTKAGQRKQNLIKKNTRRQNPTKVENKKKEEAD